MINNRSSVGIVAECMCDLPKKVLANYDIDILYFLIETETGVFTDTDEITAENIISYMENGGKKTRSSPPSQDVYKKIFEKKLKKYDEVILVTISSAISPSYEYAKKAAALVDGAADKIHIFDSGHLSSGLGFLVMHAAELADKGYTAEKIIPQLEDLKGRISTTFMTKNADYLYRNELVPKIMKTVCTMFNLHPILKMKNGHITLKSFTMGNYDYACRKYIRRELKNNYSINTKRGFITHVGCSIKTLRSITAEIKKYHCFDELDIVSASATISSNCGPGTFGILFINN